MKRCALLTCDDLENHILDEEYLENALKASGWEFQWVSWNKEDIPWDEFRCAIIRTTWDYTEDTPRFLSQLEKISQSQCRLFNEYSTIVWNTQKTYLKKFASAGVSVIPTLWKNWNELERLQEELRSFNSQKVVIKPQVGASAKNTFSLSLKDEKAWEEAFSHLQNEEIMAQPFMEKVITEGEFSAHFFVGEFSHMVLKTPKANDFRSQEEFGSHVRKVEIKADQLNFCNDVLRQIPETTLYARVDFINDGEGVPFLNELELVEPSLYFRYDQEAATRMVAGLEKLME